MEWNGELGYITLVCNNSLELKQKNMCDIFACIIPRINYHQRNGSQHTEAVAWRCSVKKVFLEFLGILFYRTPPVAASEH